jgi:hypothetical protein
MGHPQIFATIIAKKLWTDRAVFSNVYYWSAVVIDTGVCSDCTIQINSASLICLPSAVCTSQCVHVSLVAKQNLLFAIGISDGRARTFAGLYSAIGASMEIKDNTVWRAKRNCTYQSKTTKQFQNHHFSPLQKNA